MSGNMPVLLPLPDLPGLVYARVRPLPLPVPSLVPALATVQAPQWFFVVWDRDETSVLGTLNASFRLSLPPRACVGGQPGLLKTGMLRSTLHTVSARA